MSVDLALWILAAVCFGLRALGFGSGRVDLGWLGVMFVALTFVFH